MYGEAICMRQARDQRENKDGKKDLPYGEMRYERERPEMIEKQHEDDRQNVQKSRKKLSRYREKYQEKYNDRR